MERDKMVKYACKRVCQKCCYCNEVSGGFIDCYFGTFIDPTTMPGMPVQTTLEKFHKCYRYVRLETQDDEAIVFPA